MANKNPKFSKRPWRQVVEEADPDRRKQPTTAYQFSNARRFAHRRNPYT